MAKSASSSEARRFSCCAATSAAFISCRSAFCLSRTASKARASASAKSAAARAASTPETARSSRRRKSLFRASRTASNSRILSKRLSKNSKLDTSEGVSESAGASVSGFRASASPAGEFPACVSERSWCAPAWAFGTATSGFLVATGCDEFSRARFRTKCSSGFPTLENNSPKVGFSAFSAFSAFAGMGSFVARMMICPSWLLVERMKAPSPRRRMISSIARALSGAVTVIVGICVYLTLSAALVRRDLRLTRSMPPLRHACFLAIR